MWFSNHFIPFRSEHEYEETGSEEEAEQHDEEDNVNNVLVTTEKKKNGEYLKKVRNVNRQWIWNGGGM